MTADPPRLLDWTGRRVLVTGATGFIGSAVTALLRTAGADVRAVSRRPGSPAGASCDLCDFDACRRLVAQARPQVIVHLAGHPFAARDLSRVVPAFRDNLASAVHLMTAAADTGVDRLVLAGSLETPEPGEDPGPPSSPYAASKAAAASYAAMFHRQFGLPVVVARLFMVYGPGQRDPTKLIPHAAESMLRGDSPRIASGERPVDWVYIDDAASGLLALGAAPGVEGCTIDVGTGVLTTVREVVEQLARLVPGAPTPQFGAAPSRRDEQVRAARVQETRRLTGWSARVALTEGLARTIEWTRREAGVPQAEDAR